ncbi:hypothetical protein ABENE_19975 [Asticcacaulis benevestitus DSM 16100 = ATCC BAA-896]|uniref:Transposase DDE domain-containing protein n=1 Tax=Asticcacaulis benevestitus DSM 16100 = ATCC BAA-896 TaxID=1121022 RepID=V4QX82_9CAUL|nr:hypothetical protein ABENE_19975 [Asticcacaulis benevestitus DSM 16100 = ATCC BAA-896]
MCGGIMLASRTKQGPGPANAGSSPRSNGTPANSFRVSRFIVTNLSRKPKRVAALYNQRDTAEQYIKEGKNAVKWTRLSYRTMKANAIRPQLHALAYNLSNFLSTLALPEEMKPRSLTSLCEKVVKIGAKS